MAKRKLVYMPLAEIAPADRNPKGHDDDVIAGSIDEFGFLEPMVLDERTGKLIAGHGRRDFLLKAEANGDELPDGIVVAKGVWTAPVVRGFESRDDDHAHAAGVAVNHATIKGGWIMPELVSMLDDLRQTDNLIGTGFDDIDLDRMIEEMVAEQDAQPTARSTPDPKPLQLDTVLFAFGDYRGNCTRATYDRFVTSYEAQREAGAQTIEGVLLAWLDNE